MCLQWQAEVGICMCHTGPEFAENHPSPCVQALEMNTWLGCRSETRLMLTPSLACNSKSFQKARVWRSIVVSIVKRCVSARICADRMWWRKWRAIGMMLLAWFSLPTICSSVLADGPLCRLSMSSISVVHRVYLFVGKRTSRCRVWTNHPRTVSSLVGVPSSLSFPFEIMSSHGRGSPWATVGREKVSKTVVSACMASRG